MKSMWRVNGSKNLKIKTVTIRSSYGEPNTHSHKDFWKSSETHCKQVLMSREVRLHTHPDVDQSTVSSWVSLTLLAVWTLLLWLLFLCEGTFLNIWIKEKRVIILKAIHLVKSEILPLKQNVNPTHSHSLRPVRLLEAIKIISSDS